MNCTVLKLFQLLNGDLSFSWHTYTASKKVCKPRLTKLGQCVEVRAHYKKNVARLSFRASCVRWSYYELICMWNFIWKQVRQIKSYTSYTELSALSSSHCPKFATMKIKSPFECCNNSKLTFHLHSLKNQFSREIIKKKT